MVEAIANGIEDKLIDGLSFKMNLGPATSLTVASPTTPRGPTFTKLHRGLNSSGFCSPGTTG